jgi:exopolysaccharide production protein ExoZ
LGWQVPSTARYDAADALNESRSLSPTGNHLAARGEKLFWLQSLRGIAALMVLFFHMAPHWALVPQLEAASRVMHWGFSGVDIFFVLSGFVVYQSGVISIPKHGFLDFIKKRFARIYTTYWATFFLVTLLSAVILKEYPKSTEQIVKSFFLLYPKFWDNWIAVAWSLTYELYFYLILGLLLFLPKKYQTKAIITTTLYLILWNCYWLFFHKEKVLADAHPLRFFSGGFIIEFLFGALVGVLFNKRRDLFKNIPITYPLALIAVSFGFILGSQSHFYNQVEIMRAASYGVMAISMLLITLNLEHCKYKPPRILVMIGDSSFSLYLIHSVFLGILGTIRHRYLGTHQEVWLVFSLFMPIFVVFISHIWYLAVEKKTIIMIRKI